MGSSIMKLEECRQCEFHMEHVSDSILCRFNHEIEHRVLNGDTVIACPKAEKPRGLKALFKRS
ncbi:MAG: hypothetical protein CVV44_07570 [Spirochaetae bacterium HGW-Spirochaetae-1]|nr:MAG: hypothetical protein CVV44_07570 [Spirochaetae bacterium HGW-Spirochaetae-1]